MNPYTTIGGEIMSKKSKTETAWTTVITIGELDCSIMSLDDPEGDPDPDEPVNVTLHERLERWLSSWITAEFRGKDITDRITDLERNWLNLVLANKKPLSREDRDRLRYRTAGDFLENDFIYFLPDKPDDEYNWLAPLGQFENSSLGPLRASLAALEAGASSAEATTKWEASAAKLLSESDFPREKQDDDAAVDTCPACGMSNPDDPFPERLSSAMDRLKNAVDTYWKKQKTENLKREKK